MKYPGVRVTGSGWNLIENGFRCLSGRERWWGGMVPGNLLQRVRFVEVKESLTFCGLEKCLGGQFWLCTGLRGTGPPRVLKLVHL